MKRKLPFLLLLLFTISGQLFSQDFLGLSTGNYAGVTGVMLQPASIVDSRHKFDVNIFSTNVRYSNNYYLVNRDAILKFNKNNFEDYQTFKSKYLSEATLASGEKAFFNISNRTQLPLSFMATTGKKSAIALNFQSRSMIQGRNITQDLAKLAYNGFYYQPLNNRPLDASGLTINSLNWIEAGLTFGRVLYSSDRHFFKGAFTAKYLGGIASLNMGSNNFKIGVNSDSSINFTTNNFNYNHNKNADFDMVFDKNTRPDASAFGFDAGLVYEYRGNFDNFKYIRNDDEFSYEAERRDVNKYIVKLGVSLLDAGMFTFAKPANVNSFSGDVTAWDVRNAHYSTIKEFDTALANRVTALPNDPNNYNVYLPGALSVQLDVRFVKGLFLNVMAYRPLKMGSDDGFRFNNYGFYTITPRYERRHFGIYIPYTFSDKNDLTNYRENRLGATIRVGPLFIGSSNLGTMAFNKNLKAADVHVGLKIGITYGKPSKVSQFFDKHNAATELPATDYKMTSGVKVKKVVDSTVYISKDTDTKNRLLVDYTKGQVFSADKNGQVVIINNNYYYGNNTPIKKDTVYSTQDIRMVPAESATYIRDSLNQVVANRNRKADSTSNVLKDSIEQKKVQLDSLIYRLQILRLQMDSTKLADSLNAYMNMRNTLNNQAKALEKQQSVTGSASDNNQQALTDSDSSQNAVAVSGSIKKVKNDPITSAKNNTNATATATDTASNFSSGTARSLAADSLKSSSSQNGQAQSIKKKTKPATDTVIVVQKQMVQQPAPAANPSVVVNTPPNYQQQNGNDDQYNRYFRESARLQSEINSLQRQMNNASRTRNNAPAQYPYVVSSVTAPAATVAAPPAQRDTIYLRDTVRISDTVRITTNDTLVKNVPSKPTKVYVPVQTEKIVKEKIDYTNLPSETVLFGLGKSTVGMVYINRLDYIAGILKKDTSLAVSITGHTDNSGSHAVNEALSKKRANALKSYFINKGIQENRLQVAAVASLQPVVEGNDKAANSQNRRVVIKIIVYNN